MCIRDSLILSLLCLWHYVACGYFYLSDPERNAQIDPATLFRGGAFSPPPQIASSGLAVRYVQAYYWAVATSTQVTRPSYLI